MLVAITAIVCTTTSTSTMMSSLYASALAPGAPPFCLSRAQTSHSHRALFAGAASTENSNSAAKTVICVGDEHEETGCSASTTSTSDNDDVCGNGFYKRTTPDGGEYCVFDYDSVTAVCAAGEQHDVVSVSDNNNNNKNDEHEHRFWDALNSQNKSRKKFGLPPLSLEEYVALQAQNHHIGMQNIADATSQIFSEFDSNDDGVVSVKELHEGLEKVLKRELPEKRVHEVMKHFDSSGDGVLQQNEFVTLDQFRKKLDAVAKEEERLEALDGVDSSEKHDYAGILHSFLNSVFQSTCESNYDCDRPQVCCDFGYKKMCCTSGKTTKEFQLEYATVPVVQNY